MSRETAAPRFLASVWSRGARARGLEELGSEWWSILQNSLENSIGILRETIGADSLPRELAACFHFKSYLRFRMRILSTAGMHDYYYSRGFFIIIQLI